MEDLDHRAVQEGTRIAYCGSWFRFGYERARMGIGLCARFAMRTERASRAWVGNGSRTSDRGVRLRDAGARAHVSDGRLHLFESGRLATCPFERSAFAGFQS